MSNFAFLKGEWPELHASAIRGEALSLTDPRGACFYARRTLELAVNWLYTHDPTLSPAYDDNLSALLHASAFQQLLGRERFLKARLVKDLRVGREVAKKPNLNLVFIGGELLPNGYAMWGPTSIQQIETMRSDPMLPIQSRPFLST